jgi:hypothetical protein
MKNRFKILLSMCMRQSGETARKEGEEKEILERNIGI